MEQFVKSCVVCGRAKAQRHQPYGTLQQLPIPERPWHSMSMDFIEQLPELSGFSAILVIVNRFTKQAPFLPMTDQVTSKEVAQLYFKNVFTRHGVLGHITSNQGTEFVSHFFHSLSSMLSICLPFTLGYHPQANGQTKRINQILEQYLLIHCNYQQQDNWEEWIPIAEFAYNNAESSVTGTTPFFANKGYHPELPTYPNCLSTSQAGHCLVTDLADVHSRLWENLRITQECTQETADAAWNPRPLLEIGAKAYATNMVNLHLLKTDGECIHALAIPLQGVARLSLHPLRWLCFITFAAVGAKGDLSEAPGGNVVDYENVLLNDLAEDYCFTPDGNTPTSKPSTTNKVLQNRGLPFC